MPDRESQPIVILLSSHWITMLGVTLVTLAGCSWLFLLPAHLRGHVSNPYMGLLVFLAIPALFFLGLALIPVGIALARRRVAHSLGALPDRATAYRRAGLFFASMTVANVVIGSQVSYRAVEHMETVQFCGLSCHVMKPEFTGHQREPHQQVACVGCHVVPGAAGWLQSKMAGTRQLAGVVLNSFPRPIESAMESNRLVSSVETCEQCHARDMLIGPRLRVITKYKDDEANTRTETVLTMLVGGGKDGGIHGAHMGPGVLIRYTAGDRKRQTIPWVEYRNSATGVTRTYVAGDTKPDPSKAFDMQCVDCHNRAAHSFDQPDRAIDAAMSRGLIAAGLPFVKKTGLDLIKADYPSDAEAATKIPAGLAAFYQQKYPAIANKREAEIKAAGVALLAIYQSNVFPDLKVTWGTYPNNLGHTDYPGCFRCHDDSHAAPDKKTIKQDCSTCHQAVAVEETSPEILTTLGAGKNQ